MSALWEQFKHFITTVFDAIPLIIKDSFVWAFDKLTGGVNSLLEGLSFSMTFLDFTQYIDALPVESKQMMALIGVTQATTMIVTSLGIRLLLQLIPFTRLGS